MCYHSNSFPWLTMQSQIFIFFHIQCSSNFSSVVPFCIPQSKFTVNKKSHHKGFPAVANCQESAWQCRGHKRPGLDPWLEKIPWRRKWQPTPIFLPEKLHGQSRPCKKSRTSFHEVEKTWTRLSDTTTNTPEEYGLIYTQ